MLRFTHSFLGSLVLAGLVLVAGVGTITPVWADNPASEEAMVDKDLIDVAVEAGSFETLAAALEAADLIEALKGEGPFTVFAPTDEAFAALPEGTVEELLMPENKETLAAILTYHVVEGKVLSTDLEAGEVETLQGSPITVDLSDGVTINQATVTTADVAASNGVIHVIDAVILPPEVQQ